MKKHTHLIRLIVATAALIGLGVMAFKYLQTPQASPIKINPYTFLEKEMQSNLHLKPSDNVNIQAISRIHNPNGFSHAKSPQTPAKSSYGSSSCVTMGQNCSSSIPCCSSGETCSFGRCN